MSSLREQEISQWLENKLGSSDDLWNARAICSWWTKERLLSVPSCFVDLQSQVKLKLLLSILHLSKRNHEQWGNALEDILSLACQDTDEWVQAIAELLKEFPFTGALNLNMEQPNSEFLATLESLKTACKLSVKKRGKNASATLPIEAVYINRNVVQATFGALPTQAKHFNLKRKPKSAALRADLLQKSFDAANQVKSKSVAGVPMRTSNVSKKIDTTTPLKGISLPNAAKTSGGFGATRTFNRPAAPKREGGIKFIELEETPQAKKQRRRPSTAVLASVTHVEDGGDQKDGVVPVVGSRKRKKSAAVATGSSEDTEQEVPKPVAAVAEVSVSSQSNEAVASGLREMPDYAAGLFSPATDVPVHDDMPYGNQAATHSGADRISVIIRPSASSNALHAGTLIMPPQVQPQQQQRLASVAMHNYTLPSRVAEQLQPALSTHLADAAAGRPIFIPANLPLTTFMRTAQAPSSSYMSTAARAPSVPLPGSQDAPSGTGAYQAQVQQHYTPPVRSMVPHDQTQSLLQTPALQQRGAVYVPMQQPQHVPVQVQSVVPDQPERLRLSRELMAEAQELFRNANKLTRPEKALIMGFMAGNRKNPCPEMGSIITVRLSEDKEQQPMPDGSVRWVLAESFFQMDYNTGRWQRLVKQRELPLGELVS